jgi:hypothetical protein
MSINRELVQSAYFAKNAICLHSQLECGYFKSEYQQITQHGNLTNICLVRSSRLSIATQMTFETKR